MNGGTSRAGVAGIALAAISLLACDSCAAPVAELLEKDGAVERTPAGPTDAWGEAPVGQTFAIGEAVRTGPGATARLRVGTRGGVHMQPATVLRFLSERPDRAAGVRVETGEIELDSEDAIDVETTVGAVTLLGGGRARVRGDGSTPRVEVIAGRVQFEENGEVRTAEAGDAVVLAVGRVVFEDGDDPTFGSAPGGTGGGTRAGAGAGAGAVAGTGPEAETAAETGAETEAGAETEPGVETETEAGAETGRGEEEAVEAPAGGRFEASPARAHLSIPAGESPVVHDPGEAPTAVRIVFGAGCPDAGVVTLSGQRRATRWRGEGGSAIVALAPGRARYAIRCETGRAVPGGAITVRRDDGSHRLQSVPPRNVVDADGRTYDVLYQNALPILVVRWRDAGAGPLQLHVVTAGRDRAFPAPGGRAELGSGELGDGTHRVFFAAGGRRSPETTVRIRFDNAAPTASLREPAASAPLRGPTAHVSGVVLSGFTVRVGSTELPIDGQQRFSGDVPLPADFDALAVRISHPRRGVHYYLRRVAR